MDVLAKLKTRLVMMVVVLGLGGCRDSHFDSDPIGFSQRLLSVQKIESRVQGHCEGRQDCFEIQLSVWIKDQRGRPLPHEDIALKLSPSSRLLSQDLESKSGPDGRASFVLLFHQLASERGLRYASLFEFQSRGLGQESYCGNISALSSLSPIQDFGPCAPEEFTPAVFGDRAQLDILPTGSSVLNRNLIHGGREIVTLRAAFRVIDLVDDRAIKNTDCQWTLTPSESEPQSGSAQTNSVGDFFADFSIERNPFADERLTLVAYQVSVPALNLRVNGELALDLFSDSHQVLVAYGRDSDPIALHDLINRGQASLDQNLILDPKLFRFVEEKSGWSINSELRLGESRHYAFSFDLRIRQYRRRPDLKDPALDHTPISGKVFLMQYPETILHEWRIEGTTDERGSFSISDDVFVENFSKDPRSVYLIVSLEAPTHPSLPTLLRRVTPRTETQLDSTVLSRADAERILGGRLQNPIKPNLRVPLDVQTFLASKGFVGLDKLTHKQLHRNARVALVDILKQDWSKISDRSWDEIYRLFFPPQSEVDARSQPSSQSRLSAYRVVEVTRVLTPPRIEMLRSPIQFESLEGEWSRVSIDVEAEGKECLTLSMDPPSGGDRVDAFVCKPEVTHVTIRDEWQYIRIPFNQEALLLREGLGFEKDLVALRRRDYFRHPHVHEHGLIREPLWPVKR